MRLSKKIKQMKKKHFRNFQFTLVSTNIDYNGANPDKLFTATTLRLEPSGFK